MADHDPTLDRRQLLARLSAAALFLSGHQGLADEPPAGAGSPADRPAPGPHDPRILALDLATGARLADLEAFYAGKLEFPVLGQSEERIAFQAGTTEIRFTRTSQAETAPFYHFAFNIPENKIRAAREWQLERSELFITPENLRDPAYPDDVRHFRGWNAHSVFFWDPAGNVVEYIARHDLDNAETGPFSTRDIHYASEIAFVVDDVPASASALRENLGLDSYRPGSRQFWPIGDERGLLLLFESGREIGDRLRGRPAQVSVYETRAEIRGGADAVAYDFPDYPYEIVTR